MNTFYRNLFILVTIIVHLQFIMSYPSSNLNEQRTFLRCHFSAIACKRSLSALKDPQNPSSIINKNDLQTCINENKPIWFCLNQSPPYTLEDIDQNN